MSCLRTSNKTYGRFESLSKPVINDQLWAVVESLPPEPKDGRPACCTVSKTF